MLNAFMRNVIIKQCVIMLNVIVQSVIILHVVAPFLQAYGSLFD
jgi:hypothetical protein